MTKKFCDIFHEKVFFRPKNLLIIRMVNLLDLTPSRDLYRFLVWVKLMYQSDRVNYDLKLKIFFGNPSD